MQEKIKTSDDGELENGAGRILTTPESVIRGSVTFHASVPYQFAQAANNVDSRFDLATKDRFLDRNVP